MESDLLLDIGVGLFAGAVAWSLASLWFDNWSDSTWVLWTLLLWSVTLSAAGHLASEGLFDALAQDRLIPSSGAAWVLVAVAAAGESTKLTAVLGMALLPVAAVVWTARRWRKRGGVA